MTGPARSGKSRWAETLASRSGLQVAYLATGPELNGDTAWQERLRLHRQRRPSSWINREVGFALSTALRECQPEQIALVDSLGTWVAGGLDLVATDWRWHCEQLFSAIEDSPAPLILVGEETGWGVVPATAAGGLFRDRLGSLLETLMERCDRAWLVIHGRALDLKALSVPVPAAETDTDIDTDTDP
ncbi:MAG: bifunctional adenosylcobinamide kinase/adenosylcobinamide-phosphate guanylyltransferase [Cyanobacteriota bacterium]|nr:bifunctional adenosylcobinamide kinase/adenosylcobinamide-phosphate guanylyltransferase [Cyanobacteriota bacterium]